MKDRLGELHTVTSHRDDVSSSSGSSSRSHETGDTRWYDEVKTEEERGPTQWYDTPFEGCDSAPLVNKSETAPLRFIAKLKNRKRSGSKSQTESDVSVEILQSKINLILEDVRQIRGYTKELSAIHTSALISPSISEDTKSKMAALTEKTRVLSLQVSKQLKDVEKSTVPEGAAVRRIHSTQLFYARRAYVTAMEHHEAQLERYAGGLRNLVSQQMAIVRNSACNLPDLEAHIENGNVQLFVDNYQLREQAVHEETLAMLENVSNRHIELAVIEQSIVDIRDLFVQMAFLVEQQGETIDSIEAHVLAAAEQVTDGRGQLKEARKKKKSAREKKVWLAGAGAGVAAGLLTTILILA